MPAVAAGARRSQAKPARLRFAEWLVADDNPLTPRVTVNRMWQEYFGKGLVTTPADFGIQGATAFASGAARLARLRDGALGLESEGDPPSDRDLGDLPPGVGERVPISPSAIRRTSYWRARIRLRLKAELIRDYALAASGLLYPKIGGPSVRPPQPKGVAELGYSKKEWVEETGPERYRRGLYIHFQRTAPYPMLVSFDAPGTQVSAAFA